MKTIQAAIIGGAGYTGGEAIRLLLNHPQVQLAYVHSESNAGNPLYQVHTDLLGDTEMKFTDTLSYDVDVLILCVGHGAAVKFMERNEVPAHVKVIDLSQDFRLHTRTQSANHRFVYGLPEVNREAIRGAQAIANPGCFATCLQLGLLPLAAAGLLKSDVHISATTGSTGAGQALSATTHFTWRANNVSIYKAFEHQHLNEIGETLHTLQPGFDASIRFIPYRGDFTRGIFASIYTDFAGSLSEALDLYKAYYREAAFTHVSDGPINLKQVVNTNKCLVALEKHGDKLLITSTIDNLLKGASGQAVQNLNLLFDLPEDSGLRLKASAF
ncbi:MAG: N-acetyl-gamma-glutamyl-phosphate reductase [Rikenellaceae bacterium]|jgi:N-acetyl-gamma-glutamyl-phosphate reductase|nr:N-acetyl-gamma-glutamyl-phosphate reductase [Rikenellaceae bacterium]